MGGEGGVWGTLGQYSLGLGVVMERTDMEVACLHRVSKDFLQDPYPLGLLVVDRRQRE